MVHEEFKEDYKAKIKVYNTTKDSLKSYNNEKLTESFEQVVSWCINDLTEKLEEVLDTPSDSIYKELIFSNVKDDHSGYKFIPPSYPTASPTPKF